jgi:ABC-type antimicrobial peptide transport system permease subunit
MVVRQGFVLALAGVAVGSVVSLAATSTLRTLMFGVTARDPMTFVVVACLLAVIAAAASYVPARRATRIDPLVALRGN